MLRVLWFGVGVRMEKVSHVTVSRVWGEKGEGVTCYGFSGLGGNGKRFHMLRFHICLVCFFTFLKFWTFLTFHFGTGEPGSGGPGNQGGHSPRGTRGADRPVQPTGCFSIQLEPLIGKPNWGTINKE